MLKEIKILMLFAVCGLASARDRRLYGNPDEIMFPSDISSRSNVPKRTRPVLPLELARKVDEADTVEEFLRIIGVTIDDRDVLIQSRVGVEERSNAVDAKPAGCTPEPELVSLYENGDPSVMYWPKCIRVKRCSGCCTSELDSCQPVATVTTNYKVRTMKENANGRPEFGVEIIPVEEHTRCKCSCRIKPEHCNPKQKYNPDRCSCDCTNTDEAEKCRKSNHIKVWNEERCACECRGAEQDCTTGNYFDPIECRCQRQSWFNVGRGTTYDVPGTPKSRDSSSPVIVPFGSDHKRRQNKDDPEYK